MADMATKDILRLPGLPLNLCVIFILFVSFSAGLLDIRYSWVKRALIMLLILDALEGNISKIFFTTFYLRIAYCIGWAL